MPRETIKISNKLGLHARAAAKLVQTAARFESEISLIRDAKHVNGKSIMGVMMLAAGKGVEVEIDATGADADAALTALVTLINEKFGEPE